MGAVDIYHMQIAEDVISASVDNGLRDLHMVFFAWSQTVAITKQFKDC